MVAGFKADLIKARTGEDKAVACAARWAWRTCTPPQGPETSFHKAVPKQFDGVWMASTGFTDPSTLEAARPTIDSGHGDLWLSGCFRGCRLTG